MCLGIIAEAKSLNSGSRCKLSDCFENFKEIGKLGSVQKEESYSLFLTLIDKTKMWSFVNKK